MQFTNKVSVLTVDLFSLFFILFFFISVSYAAQLPLPIESIPKSGSPNFTQISSNWIGDVGSWAREAFVDLDADGDYDMLVGDDSGYLEYWRNDGNFTSPIWILANSNLLGQTIDSYNVPSVLDFDKDGDFDIITGANDGWIRYFENKGSPSSPNFEYTQAWVDGGTRTAPAFFDYNNDGDYDFIYGRENQYIYKMKNDVSQSSYFFDDFVMDDVGAFSAPALVDIDYDGDFDLFVGDSLGNVTFYENDGIADAPVWLEEVHVVSVATGNAVPVFADWDADNDQDMLVGKTDGTLDYFRNDGSKYVPVWVPIAGIFTMDVGSNSAGTVADLDNDRDFDIAIGNSIGAVHYYRNDGDASNPLFTYMGTFPISTMPYAKPVLKDLDNDIDFDLAIGNSTGFVLYFRNDGTPSSYSFVPAGNLLGDTYDNAAQTFADLDNDGDHDMFTGTEGGWIAYYENKGSVSNPTFLLERTFWLDNHGRYESHDFVDFDNDGDYDLIMGQEDGYVRYYRNDGDATRPVWTYVRNWIGDFGDWTAPSMGDMDNDGDYDIVLGRSNDAYLHYFENDASASSVNWTTITENLIGDLGTYTYTETGDLDADGDLDLLVGNYDGFVSLYRNNGTPSSPEWSLVTSNLLGDVGYVAAPAFGDLDADGDLDLLVGTDAVTLRYYRNDGNSTNYNFTLITTNWLSSNCRPGDGNGWCSPELVDLDSDGDLDLVVSNYYYGPYYWRNDGSPQIPAMNPIGDMVGDPGDRTKADFADIEGDGDLDMAVGRENGLTYYYKNVGTPTSPIWQYVYSGSGGDRWIQDIGDNAKPDFGDYDSDGDTDLLVGEQDGFVNWFQNNGIYATDIERGNNPTWLYKSGNFLNSYCRPGDGNGVCAPEISDLDSDGDFDLIVSNYQCVHQWRNDGSPQIPYWASVGDIACYGAYYYNSYPGPALGDMDNDGDLDLLIGKQNIYSAAPEVVYYKNTGSPSNASWQYVYAGWNGVNYIPNPGGTPRVDIVDINNDSMNDVSIENSAGDFFLLKNRGLFTTPKDKGKYPTWVDDGILLTIPDSGGYSSIYGVPALADLDGDGDLDLTTGSRGNCCWGGRVYYFRNDGTAGNPNYVFVSDLVSGIAGGYFGPAFGDMNGDRDFDLVVGNDQGFVYYFENRGNYSIATTVILRNSFGAPVGNASVIFSDSSGIVCDGTTDSNGTISCVINYTGGFGRIDVQNATEGGSITLGILSPFTNGIGFITLDNPITDFSIGIERLSFNTFDPNTNPNEMRVDIFDRNQPVFRGFASPVLDAFLPKRYLANMQEPFTQNRITYDIIFNQNPSYASSLIVDDIYVPNEINASSAEDAKKLFKFLSAMEMSTDSQYKSYVIFPVSQAQYNFQITDSIPDKFNFTGNATLSYQENSCSVEITGTSFSIGYSDPGCNFLSKALRATGDWLKLEYAVVSPSLDLFIEQGWETQSFLFPAPILNLNA